MISVITACKNEKMTIEQTILSVLSQTCTDYELIIIDGGSTDGTLDIIEKYKDKISYFISEKDSGIYNAMNKGIEASRGDILYFLNANDTLFDEHVFAKIVKSFDENPEAQFIFGDANCISQGQAQIVSHVKYHNHYYLFINNYLHHQAMFYKKELFEKFGYYDEKYFIAGDADRNVCFLIKHNTPTLYLNKPLTNYSLNGISCDLKYKKLIDKEAKEIYLKYYKSSYYLAYYGCKLYRLIKYMFPKFKFKKRIKTINVKMVP